jgi:HlyD family secretion protein
LQAAPRPVDLRAAQAGAQAAQEGVAAAEAATEVAKANAAVGEAAQGVAQAALAKLQAGPSAEEREIARLAVEQAKAQLLAAQGQRDSVGGTPGRLPGSYEGAQGAVAASEFAISIADLSRQQVQRGARTEDIASAQAAVKQARAALETAQAQEKAARQQVLIAKSQAQQAQAQVELLQAPAREEDLAAARAQVAQAEAAIKAARGTLEKTRLLAPFAGTVSAVEVRVGEFVVPGVSVLALGDSSAWRVETTDLDEIDVARVAVGRPATITFDALPNTRLRCKVESIAVKAGSGGGGTTFKVVLALEETDPRLRWGMTAFANIETE